MFQYVEVEVEGRRALAQLPMVTLVTGSGKSLFLEVIYRTVASVGRKVPRFRGRWQVVIQGDDVLYSLQVDSKRVRQTVALDGEEYVFENVPSRGIHRVVKPVEFSVREANVVLPVAEAAEHVSIVADEVIERINAAVARARAAIGRRVVMLGPYVDPAAAVDAGEEPHRHLDRHARNLVGVLAHMALYRPGSFATVAGAARKLGYTISVGWAGRGKMGLLVRAEGRSAVPITRAPCSLKMALAVATALELEPELVLIDNLDYCMDGRVAALLSHLLKQRKVQLVAEIHDERIAEMLDVPSKSLISVSL